VIVSAGATTIALTTDIAANASFNTALVHFPAVFDADGGLFEIGDLQHCVWRLNSSGNADSRALRRTLRGFWADFGRRTFSQRRFGG
jgi:hypothetical protein